MSPATAAPPPAGTLELLARLAREDAGPTLPLATLLEEVGERVYGVLLLVATLPAFIPLPFGVGAIAGPLVALVGLQLALMRARPWLPRRLGQREIRRAGLRQFLHRAGPALRWLERVLRPRRGELLDLRPARVFTGLLLMALGLLLALPIPFTNYPFGVLLVLYSVALIEHDGRLMLIAWSLGGVTILGVVLLSEVLARWLMT